MHDCDTFAIIWMKSRAVCNIVDFLNDAMEKAEVNIATVLNTLVSIHASFKCKSIWRN